MKRKQTLCPLVFPIQKQNVNEIITTGFKQEQKTKEKKRQLEVKQVKSSFFFFYKYLQILPVQKYVHVSFFSVSEHVTWLQSSAAY